MRKKEQRSRFMACCMAACLGLLLLPTRTTAAADDFQFRGGIRVRKEFRKGFDLGLEYQVRTDNNARHFRGSYFTVAPEYKLDKHWTVLAEFRYGTSYRWDRTRYGAGMQWRQGMGKWKLTLQAKYQYERFVHAIPEIGLNPPSHFIRVKGEAAYRLSAAWKGYAGCEPRYVIGEGNSQLQRIRYTAGMEWEFVKNHSVDVSYAAQPQFNLPVPVTTWILEVQYGWTLPKTKKKKELPPSSP